jgi:tetratricopeptide (TPR) repeat protein
MSEERRGVHPAWISVAGFAGAAVALVGVGIPLNSTRTKLREERERAWKLEKNLREAQELQSAFESMASKERRLREEIEEKSAGHGAELQTANAEIARLRARLAQAFSDRQSASRKDDPQLARRLQAEARAMFREGRAKEAIERLGKALEVDSLNAGLYVDRGYLRLQGKDTAGAVADFEAALRIDSNNAMAWNNLAMVRLNQKDGAAALDLARRALRCDPNLVNAWIMRMAAAKLLENWREVERSAVAALERMNKGDPRHKMVLKRLQEARDALAAKGETE